MWRIATVLVWIGLAVAGQPVPTRTIMDILSSNPEFSELVGLLQGHGLIPIINQSCNSTFLAPVNSAFIGLDKESISRDQLLYHFVNATVRSSDISHSDIIYNTYLDDGKAPISLSLERGVNSVVPFEELDLLASPHRGVVHVLPSLVSIPERLSKQLLLRPETSLFGALVDNPQLLEYATVLVPQSTAMIEDLKTRSGINDSTPLMKYLRSAFGDKDRYEIVKRHIWSDIPIEEALPISFEALDGANVTILANRTVLLNDHLIPIKGNIKVARNGLFIELGGILAPNHVELFDLTAEKIILGMGGHDMVKALTLYGHRDLIDNSPKSNRPGAIVVPVGSSSSGMRGYNGRMGSFSGTHLDRLASSPELKPRMIADPSQLILYHFLDSALPENHKIQLLVSKMMLRSRQYPQRVHFERIRSGASSLNWEVLGEDVYQWRNISFYSSEELLTAPASLLISLGPLLVSSYSMSFLDKLGRLQLPVSNSWTIFLPTREAWEQNLLLKDYLDSNDEALAQVFDNLLLRSPIYSDSDDVETTQFTGEATTVRWNRKLKEVVIESDNLNARLQTEVTDALFDNGVAHIVEDVPLPGDLEISAIDLIEASGQSYFVELVKAAGMESVLAPEANFTVLVPPAKELKKYNITPETPQSKLQSILSLHLIPDGALGNRRFDDQLATTVGGDEMLIFALDSSGRFYGIAPAAAKEGQQALFTKYGFTNGRISGGSAVILIDRHISPQWIIPVRSTLRSLTYLVFGLIVGLVLTTVAMVLTFAFFSRPPKDDRTDSGDTEYHDDVYDENDDVISGEQLPETADSA